MRLRAGATVAVAAALAIDGCAATVEQAQQRPPSPGAPVKMNQGVSQVEISEADEQELAQFYATQPGGCLMARHAPFPPYNADSATTWPPPPMVTSKHPVLYPVEARKQGVEGLVLVDALVCEHGRVVDTRVAQSVPMLDAAATTAVKHWVFEPIVVDGTPRSKWVRLTVKFTLQ